MNLYRAFPIVVALGMATPAHSQTQQIVGQAGYLSEWQLTGSLTERISAGKKDFSGPLVWEHVGLCTVDGPVLKQGDVSFQISTSGSLSNIDAKISFEGEQCTYRGHFSEGASGVMDCPKSGGIPFSLSFK